MIRGKKRIFDIDNPELPDWIDEHALASGDYPYDKKLDDDDYEEQLEKLQIELVKVQFWLQATGKRVMAIFEGRDAAGKGGAISCHLSYMNPRSARVVALTKPTETRAGPMVLPALCHAFSDSRRIRDVRPLLVQPRAASSRSWASARRSSTSISSSRRRASKS